MKIKVQILLCLFVLFGQALAQRIPFVVNDKVHRFVYKIHNHEPGIYRTGQLDKKDDLYDTDEPDADFRSVLDEQEPLRSVPETDVNEYRVLYDESRPKMEKFFKKPFPANEYGIIYDEYFHEYSIQKKTPDKATGAAISLEDAQKRIVKVVRTIFPFFNRKMEYDNYRIEYNGTDVEFYVFFFRRIFKGGVVKQDVSNVEITLSPQGVFLGAKIKWPVFRKATGVAPSEAIDIADAISFAIQETINAHSEATQWGSDLVMKATNAELTGMALGWFPAEMQDGSVLLTPSFSYSTQIKYDNDVELSPVVDVPRLKKYIR
jgi:hypothetical protein